MARQLPSDPARSRETRRVATALALGLASLGALATCEPRPASAEQPAPSPCGAYGDIASALRAYGEAPRFRGLDARGVVAELWVAPSGSWTLIFVDTSRKACLGAAGEAGAPLAASAEERRG